MTRLADALERAKRTADPAPQRAQARPAAPAPAAQPHVHRAQPPASVAVRNAMPAASHAANATPLLGMPDEGNINSAWRTDPQLVGKLLGTDGFSGAALEQYRKLAATLHHAQGERGIRVIMTASALPGEGKSLTAVNLALTLSESYHKRVLLVDADLRRPTVQRVFGLPAIGGLNEGLKLADDRAMAVTQISDRLFVLPAGRPEADPMSGLTSGRMRRLVTQSAAAFDWVIIDTPPVGLLPDASLLADIVDGVLLVVRAGKAPFSLVKRTVEAITHDRILGVVMNAVDYAHDRNAGGYYEYYGYGYYGGSPGQK
jgi:protein-tyrosine kinase